MAFPASTLWEIRAAGNADNGGGFVWEGIGASYDWIQSGSGTNEWYLDELSMSAVRSVAFTAHSKSAPKGTAGSLALGEWDFADNDSLGYSTVYVRLPDGADPNGKQANFVKIQEGTDYSQQDAAEQVYTDLVIDGTLNTKITSATRAFSSADIGNVVRIVSGTGWTVQRRYIVSIDGTAAIMDGSMGTLGSTGGNGRMGGAMTMTPPNMNAVVSGNDIAVRAGTHTLTGNTTVANGSVSKKVRFFGYQTTRGDNPVGTDRPLIACGAFLFGSGSYNEFSHFQFTGTAAALLRLQTASWAANISAHNSSETANRAAIELQGAGAGLRKFYAQSDAGYGVRLASTSNDAHYGFVVDCGGRGISNEGQRNTISNVIVARCPTGVYTSAANLTLLDSDIQGSTVAGLNLVGGNQNKVINVCISDSAVGITATAGNEDAHMIQNVNVHNNTVNFANVFLNGNYREIDPQYTDPATNDFRIGPNLKALITEPGANEGLKAGTQNYRDFAVLQRVEGSAAGGGQAAYAYVF